MKRFIRVLPVLLLLAAIQIETSYASGPTYKKLSDSIGNQITPKRVLIGLAGLGAIGIFYGVGYLTGYPIGHSAGEKDAKKKNKDTEGLPSGHSSVQNHANELTATTPLVPEHYQQSIIQQYKLVPFDVSEDNYADAKKKPGYLWARATFLDAHPLHLDQDDIQPALFPLNSGFDPAYPYGYATQLCTSSLPAPFAKTLRCNDEQLTGFCRIKFLLNGESRSLVGMLANTPDAYSGCLLSSRKLDEFLESLGAETLVPRDILVTDRQYYQINVSTKKVSYEFQKQSGRSVSFASTVLLSGSLRHETLCRDNGSPGTQWYTEGADDGAYGCAGLTSDAEPLGDISYFVPVRLKSSAARQSAVTWQEVPSKKQEGSVNEEVQEYFCSPRKPFKEFILGSLGGQGVHKYCRYIGTEGKSGFVATNQDGSIASDYLTPHLDESIGWEAFAGNLPEKAVVAGFSFSSPNKVSTEPVYFCRFTNNEFSTYGKYFEKGKVCKVSFATPSGDSHALVDSTNFEILVTQ
ncbi:hypothetical protein GZ77_03275 [Endozoicomonas montiporae]|uniref:Uncharacterized protein n=2 Tax=Endozoicomonas montiporae TaxID=1027273 RepID=A0A081NB06_9GAMM|nr:hypothetical protein [Endozoicomonas montiporae]AMO56669.1 hypothetical protein EZMO1_2597 [Endozoicomonas montiporae CL-33]KEQ15629.1 hypothetical protein GZ77_03275 [Endozoicomonas montiporae]